MHSKFLQTIALKGLLLCMSMAGFAQTHTSYNNLWLHYFGQNSITPKVAISLEGSMRYADNLAQKQQYFIRPSIDYKFDKKITGSLGYSYYNTYVYGSPAINKTNTPENHIWLQGTYVHKINDLKITHRLRDENRWVGIATKNTITNQYEITDTDYRNRLRYLISFNHPIVKDNNNQVKLFGIVGDEVFVNIGANAGVTLLNQNRAMIGLGYQIDKHHQIQLNYIQQHIWNFANTIQEDNPTLRISYITNFDFNKSK